MTVYKCKCGAEITGAEHDEQVGLCQDCFEDLYVPGFESFARALMATYVRNYQEKGNSWAQLDLGYLYGKLGEEYNEVADLATIGDTLLTEPEERQRELIDLALMCFMVWAKEGLEQ